MKDDLFFGWDALFSPALSIKCSEVQPHLTVQFLGKDLSLENFPKAKFLTLQVPTFPIYGKCSELSMLPSKNPKVLACNFIEEEMLFQSFQTLQKWLIAFSLHPISFQPFLPHVTISRNLAEFSLIKNYFQPGLIQLNCFHLYKSLGSGNYANIHTWETIKGFTEIEHTADVAYCIRGKDIKQLAHHAFLALAWQDPFFLNCQLPLECGTLEDMIINLNELITKVDIIQGTVFKAVSFHGEIKQHPSFLEWEMIIDV